MLTYFFLYDFSEVKFIENGKDSFIKKQKEEIETLKDELRKFKNEEDIVECEEIVEDDKTILFEDESEEIVKDDKSIICEIEQLNDLLHM